MINNIQDNSSNRQDLPIYNSLPSQVDLVEARNKQAEEAKKIQDEINKSIPPEKGSSTRSFSRLNNYMRI